MPMGRVGVVANMAPRPEVGMHSVAVRAPDAVAGESRAVMGGAPMALAPRLAMAPLPVRLVAPVDPPATSQVGVRNARMNHDHSRVGIDPAVGGCGEWPQQRGTQQQRVRQAGTWHDGSPVR